MIVLSCLSSFAYASSHFKVVALGVEPYFISDKTSGKPGVFYEVLMIAATNADIQLDIQTLPWGRAQIEVKQGRFDAILPVVKTPERESFLFYPDRAIDHFDFSIFTHKNNTLEFTGDLDQLTGLTIGKVLGVKCTLITIKLWIKKFSTKKFVEPWINYQKASV